MNEAHLDYKTAEQLGYDFYRATNDANGNPRYVIRWQAFADEYDKARQKANAIGFKVYRGRAFGSWFVGQSYNLKNTAERIIKERT
jgi:hypothetical protein